MAKSKNPLNSITNTVPPPLRNRYFLCLVVFFAWLVFFDKNDMLTQWQLAKSGFHDTYRYKNGINMNI